MVFDRHLARTRPDWLRTYRRCLWLLPLLLVGMFWHLRARQPSRTTALLEDYATCRRSTTPKRFQPCTGHDSRVSRDVALRGVAGRFAVDRAAG